MNSTRRTAIARWRPLVFAAGAVLILLTWWISRPRQPLELRVPGTDAAPAHGGQERSNPTEDGRVIAGTGTASDLPGDWPQFRGPDRTGMASAEHLDRAWTGGRPLELWSTELGEGYAGPAVSAGRVYVMDYDREEQMDALRCFSLDNGEEIWRFTYPVRIKRNHGMTRTVPAVQGNRVVAIGPKCHVICCDTQTGALIWSLDLVDQFGASVPEWYTGQCPLIDGDRVILAPGGPEALLLAVEVATGEVVWRTPNPNDWKMTHSSVMPAEIHGLRQYLYCANKGVVGVSADDGQLLWETTDWKISIATVPSPCRIGPDRVFLTGGYNAGSMMLQLESVEGEIRPSPLFRLDADTFGATQHTPILRGDHLFGIRADGQLVCLALDGRVVWESGPNETFGLGPLLMADDLLYALDDSGLLRVIEADPRSYRKLAEARVLEGRESWGPMALAGPRLLVRDFTRLACLQVGPPTP